MAVEVEPARGATGRLRECVRGQRGFGIGMAVYALTVAAGGTLLRLVEDPSRWLGALLALPPVGALGFALFSQRAAMRRREGVERMIYTETTALTFWIVMVTAVGWFFLESWADLARPSALWVWLYGLAVWGVLTLVQNRRVS